MLSEEATAYARAYQASRARRCEEHGAIFLPLEILTDRSTGTTHLSVSFSASGSSDLYVTQEAALFRAVKVTTRWLIIPWTVAKVYSKDDFVDVFSGLLDTVVVDGEPFWVIRKERMSRLKSLIGTLALDDSFRQAFEHDYLPDPEDDAT